MVAGFLVLGIAALVGAVAAALVGGPIGWGIAAVAAVIAIVAIGSFIFSMVGRYAGLPWLFTPQKNAP